MWLLKWVMKIIWSRLETTTSLRSLSFSLWQTFRLNPAVFHNVQVVLLCEVFVVFFIENLFSSKYWYREVKFQKILVSIKISLDSQREERGVKCWYSKIVKNYTEMVRTIRKCTLLPANVDIDQDASKWWTTEHAAALQFLTHLGDHLLPEHLDLYPGRCLKG